MKMARRIFVWQIVDCAIVEIVYRNVLFGGAECARDSYSYIGIRC